MNKMSDFVLLDSEDIKKIIWLIERYFVLGKDNFEFRLSKAKMEKIYYFLKEFADD